MSWYECHIPVDAAAPDLPDLVPFESGSDEQIAAMLEAYYNNELSWEDMPWSVGDTRKIHLNAMTAPNPNSSVTLPELDITVVIIDHEHTDLPYPKRGRDKACITLQTREVLHSYNSKSAQRLYRSIYINGSDTYITSFQQWDQLYMRTYLNDKVFGAFPEGAFKSAIKLSKHYRHISYGAYSDPNKTQSEEIHDHLFLPSYPEIYGTAANDKYQSTSPVEGTQFEYFKTAANRIKYWNNNGEPDTGTYIWWTGSTATAYQSASSSPAGYSWFSVRVDGDPDYLFGRSYSGLAPAFAM